MAFDLEIKSTVVETAAIPTKPTVTTSQQLEQYVGTYKSEKLPINLTISIDGNKLIGRGEGQPSFSLTTEGEHIYCNKEIGLVITFSPAENKMNFEQGGAAFEMRLEE